MTTIVIEAGRNIFGFTDGFPLTHSLNGISFSSGVIPSRGNGGGMKVIGDCIHCTKSFGNIFFCYSYCEEVAVVIALEYGEDVDWGVELIFGTDELRFSLLCLSVGGRIGEKFNIGFMFGKGFGGGRVML